MFSASDSFYTSFKHIVRSSHHQHALLPSASLFHTRPLILFSLSEWWPNGSRMVIYDIWLLNGMFSSVMGGSRCLFCRAAADSCTQTHSKCMYAQSERMIYLDSIRQAETDWQTWIESQAQEQPSWTQKKNFYIYCEVNKNVYCVWECV